jgi:hypothetical protein
LHNRDLNQPNQLAYIPENDDEELCFDEYIKKCLKSDAFERSYVIRWLMALVAQVEALDSREGHANSVPASMQNIIHEAASILALCAGTASAGTITRTFSFPLGRKNHPSVIKVQLTDVPLDNYNYSSVGAQTWGGACVLAERIVRYPEYFGLVGHESSDSFQMKKSALRILELGAGTGLVSLALAKLLKSSRDWTNCPTEIIATDFYPPVLENLQKNIASNFDTVDNEQPQPSVSVISHFLDWKTFSTAVDALPAPVDNQYTGTEDPRLSIHVRSVPQSASVT